MTKATAREPVLDLIILDCLDALELGQFYADLLGWPMEDNSDRDWVTLIPPEGGVSPDNPNGRPSLAFQRIDDWVAPTWPGGSHPQQFHLDFSVGDIDAAEPSVPGSRCTAARPPTLRGRRFSRLPRSGRASFLPDPLETQPDRRAGEPTSSKLH